MTEQDKKFAEEQGLLYPEKEDEPMIPKHQAETTFLHLSWANRRMLIALIAVCATFIITILVFVNGYTIRERNWQETIKSMWTRPTATEVENGVYEQSPP